MDPNNSVIKRLWCIFYRFLADYESMFSFHGDIEILLQSSSGVYPLPSYIGQVGP